ncbi:AtpZ/AtpI family protein [Winogradskyella alexanderae]|uniref:AtpZ/AtpI family protein n=1 Tax=Winogradskyella alexanderae TaxID=2877123 RepID=A0ABS7XMU6_9FLAO|nr:AtpZ/AtpI family protein [Winogradskyella alexanderae]MCA0131323.1 AtpZ/AtpI family protein [Winogradskyella alexanderae]
MSQSKHNHNKHKSQKDKLNSYAHYSGLVIQMMAIIGIATFIGIKLDERYPNNKDLYTLALSLTGVILSIVYVIRRIIAISKSK